MGELDCCCDTLRYNRTFLRGCSSVRQSTCMACKGSRVQIPPAPPRESLVAFWPLPATPSRPANLPTSRQSHGRFVEGFGGSLIEAGKQVPHPGGLDGAMPWSLLHRLRAEWHWLGGCRSLPGRVNHDANATFPLGDCFSLLLRIRPRRRVSLSRR